MNRKQITATLVTSCLLLTLAGCASGTDSPEAVNTATPTESLALATPTEAVAGPTAAPTAVPSAAPATDSSVSRITIEKAEVVNDHCLRITLNGQKNDITPADFTFETYNYDWTSLKEITGTLTITDYTIETAADGKTLLLCQTAEHLRSTSAVIAKKAQNFSNLDSAIKTADNYISWQMDHGGWDKGVEDQAKRAWNGTEKKNVSSGWAAKDGTPLGTIDNDATYTQMQHIAAVYREVPEAKYQESVLKGLDFIFKLQTENGGLTQVYPKRGNYSDNVTFNDNAMINVLSMLEDILYQRYPFDSDIIPEDYRTKVEACIQKAVDFILKSQIEVDGELTAWCAQHDPVTYEPVSARAYELASISGSESVPIIKFLMNQEQTPEITKAVEAALAWFKANELQGIKYIRKASDGNYFIEDGTSSTWYRFYEIGTNQPIFCDRDGIMKHDILEIGTERRHGYAWAGSWAEKLLDAYEKNGFKTGSITVTLSGENSVTVTS